MSENTQTWLDRLEDLTHEPDKEAIRRGLEDLLSERPPRYGEKPEEPVETDDDGRREARRSAWGKFSK